jgi:hypothetical protein
VWEMNLLNCCYFNTLNTDDNGNYNETDANDGTESYASRIWAFVWPSTPTAKQMLVEWRAELRKQKRELRSARFKVTRVNAKTQSEYNAAVKKSDKRMLESLEQTLALQRKTKSRLIEGEVKIDAMFTQLRRQDAMIRIQQTFTASTEVFKMLNDMATVDELKELSVSMSASMMKAGLVEQLIETVDIDDDKDVEREANKYLEGVKNEMAEKLKAAEVADESLEREFNALGVESLEQRVAALQMERA